MTTIAVVGDRLHVRFTRPEKMLGLVHDLDVPVSAVVSAAAIQDWKAVRGWRVGLCWPRLWLLGTWRWRGRRQLVALRRGRPAVRIQLSGELYDEMLIEAADSDCLLGELPSCPSSPG